MASAESAGLTDSKTVAAGAAVNSLGMLARASRALFTLFVTRVSGPQTFGLFTLAVAVVEVLTRFTVFGMDKTLLKFIPDARNVESRLYPILSSAFRVAGALSVILIVALVWLAPWISETLLRKPELEFPLRVIALSILPLTALTLVLAATKALKVMRYDAIVTGMVFPGALLLFAVPILWLDDHTAALSMAFVLAALVATTVALVFFRRHFSISRALGAPSGDALRQVLRFTTPLGLHDFVQYSAIKLEIFILAFFVSPVELGIYALASELAFVIKKFRQIFDPILIPVMSEANRAEQWRRVESNVVRVARWILVLGSFYVGGIVLFASPVLGIFGGEFVRGALPLIILCIAQIVYASTGLLDTAMMVSGRPRINLLNVCIVLVTQTALNLWLVPQFGMLGAAVAALVAFVLIGVIRVGQSLVILKLNPLSWTQGKPLLAALLAGAPIFAVQRGVSWTNAPLAWVAMVAVFGLIYVIVLRLLGLEDEDRRVLTELRWRKRTR